LQLFIPAGILISARYPRIRESQNLTQEGGGGGKARAINIDACFRRKKERKKREKTKKNKKRRVRVQIIVMKRGAAMIVFKNPSVPK